jgi:hypothetical protein
MVVAPGCPRRSTGEPIAEKFAPTAMTAVHRRRFDIDQAIDRPNPDMFLLFIKLL